MLNKIKNRKAQVGQTMTWTVATIVIFLILLLFVFAASSKTFMAIIGSGRVLTDEGSSALIDQQTLFAILSKDGGRIKGMIEGKNFDEAGKEIDAILEQFEKEGVGCSFRAYRKLLGPLETDEISPIYKKYKDSASWYSPAGLKIGDINLRLECQTK